MRIVRFRGARVATPWLATPWLFGLIPVVLVVGCGVTSHVKTESLSNGTFRLTCKTPLPRCLDHAEEVCQGNRYTVLRAADVHDYMGSQGTVGENEFRSSEAIFRCGKRGKTLWGPDADPMSESEPTTTSVAVPPSVGTRSCVPGSTQVCTGPAACRGGQSCLSDGSGFSPCDCGTGASRSTPDPAVAAVPAPAATLSPSTTTPSSSPAVPSTAVSKP